MDPQVRTAGARLEPTRIAVASASIDRFRSILDAGQWDTFARTVADLASVLRDRVVWNVNSTARGGGVAELLSALIPYERGAGLDVRWLVIQAPPVFFGITKRIHTLLHGVTTAGSEITDGERQTYEQVLATNSEALVRQVQSGDIVVLHDPQTAGLIPALTRRGCRVVWRCHVGIDRPNDAARHAWNFLRPYVGAADAMVFSRRAFVWEGLDDTKIDIIAPSIDAFTPKNQEMDGETVSAILQAAGVLPGGRIGLPATFLRRDGTSARVVRAAEIVQESSMLPDSPLVLQVSRWDRLKDPVGVMEGFSRHVAGRAEGHLLLAGPAATAVVDDPEEAGIVRQVNQAWQNFPAATRRRVHLAHLPMEDEDENAAIVNALQRRAQVVVQKSIAEGFGLTVAEAMWKARPIVATRVGGIQDQIEHGRSGLLIDDPYDLGAFGTAVVELLADPSAAQRLGDAAKARVRRHFLAPRQLTDQARLIRRLLG